MKSLQITIFTLIFLIIHQTSGRIYNTDKKEISYENINSDISLEDNNRELDLSEDNDLTSKRCTMCTRLMSAVGFYVNNRSNPVLI